MGSRSIFFRSLEKRKLVFPLLFCVLVLFLLNTVGKGIVEEIRIKLVEQSLKVNNFIREFWSNLGTLKYFLEHDINRSIAKLHRENAKLKYEIENLWHIKLENDELRSLLRLKRQADQVCYEVIIAKIVSVFSNDYVRSCIINVGSRDGVEMDDIVRSEKGFIGRVCEVHEAWSCVLAITDTNSKIPVKIVGAMDSNTGRQKDKKRESQIFREPINAILSGDNSKFLKVSMKNEDEKIKEGDIAETAYLENPACNGIPVGTVEERYGEFLIKPFADFEMIQNVCILRGK